MAVSCLGERGVVKQTFLDLPPGFVGNPAATARCTFAQLAVGPGQTPNCPAGSAVGTVEIDTNRSVAGSGWHQQVRDL